MYVMISICIHDASGYFFLVHVLSSHAIHILGIEHPGIWLDIRCHDWQEFIQLNGSLLILSQVPFFFCIVCTLCPYLISVRYFFLSLSHPSDGKGFLLAWTTDIPDPSCYMTSSRGCDTKGCLVVWIRMSPIGSCIWILSHQGVALLEKY